MWDWHAFFVKIGIPASVSSRYAEIFRQNRVSKDMLPDLDKSTLADLGVTAVGDQLAILRRGKDASFDMDTDSTSKRAHATGPGNGTEALSNGSSGSGEQRKGKLPPDRHEIYHIKMPEGNTARTKQIMQNASMMRKHGLVVRGTTGVRQGGRSVSPIDKRSPAVIRMRQEQEKAKMEDPLITRLGVRGLYSDVPTRVIAGSVHKRSVQSSAASDSHLPQLDDDVAIRVRIPASGETDRRIIRKPKPGKAVSIVNRVSRNYGGLPRVTVKLRGRETDDRPIIRSRRAVRKPIHSRLAKMTPGGRLIGSTRVATRPLAPVDYVVDDDLSAEEEEYVDEEMIWEEEEDRFDTYVDDVRPSVYNRLSR